MFKIPTKSFSTTIFVLGILMVILSFFAFIFSSANGLSYRGSDAGVVPSLLSLLFSIILVVIGNKKIVDEDYLIIFLKDYIKIQFNELKCTR